MAKKIKLPDGYVQMSNPADPAASATWNGEAFDPADGLITVPGAAAADLAGHGFVICEADGSPVDPDPPAETAPDPEPAAAPEPAPEA